MKHIERRIQQYDSMQPRYNLLTEKINALGKALIVATDPSEKFQLEKQLEDNEQERHKLDQELCELERQIDAFKHGITTYTVISAAQLAQIVALLQKGAWNTSVLMTAYHTSAPPDWSIPRYHAEQALLQSMLDRLSRAPRQTNGIFPILAFVEYLAAQNAELQRELQDWVDGVGADLNLSTEDLRHLREQIGQHHPDPQGRFSHLLVQLQPQQVDAYPIQEIDKHTFLVNAWIAVDYTGDEHYDNFHPINIKDGEESTYTFQELSVLVDELIDQAYNYMWETETDLCINFFVPRELLSCAIDDWNVRDASDMPIRIGTRYTVVVRSFERLSPTYVKKTWSTWKQCWDRLIKNAERTMNSIWFCDQEESEHTALRARLIRENIACLVLTFAPTLSDEKKDVFTAILGVGTPVALWLRQGIMEPAHIQEEFKTLVHLEHLYRLPKLVQDKRSEADGSSQPQIGHHLTLLWEDPYLLPPYLSLQAPAKRGSQP